MKLGRLPTTINTQIGNIALSNIYSNLFISLLYGNLENIFFVIWTKNLLLFERKTRIGLVAILDDIRIIFVWINDDFPFFRNSDIYREQSQNETDAQDWDIDIFQ